MARLAIIHIPDHTTDPRIIAAEITVNAGAHVVGVYDFPSRHDLKCNGMCVRKGTGAWTRHQNGFMYCAICGSRNRKVRRWLVGHLFDLLGANLLGNDAPALFRTPEGYGPAR